MTHASHEPFTDTQRMALRSHVNLAGEIVASLWPMRTFISRNPLQGLEDLHFEEAVRKGEQLFGGKGYLPDAIYREHFKQGRIHEQALNRALQPLTGDRDIRLGDRRLTHLEVLRTVMTHGIPSIRDCHEPAHREPLSAGDQDSIAQITRWMERVLPTQSRNRLEPGLPYEPEEWPSRETMADWCDRTLGTDVTGHIDRQMIKWCAAFCDEGEAAWPMPHRERTFFRAWKATAQYDLELRCLGISRAAERIRALPDRPEDALLQSLDFLNVPDPAWQEYLSLHVAALPGWAGFIKWRSNQTAYPWQEAYRIDLTKYLAVRLFYERELVSVACRQHLQCAGTFDAVLNYARHNPHAVWFRRALISGSLPGQAASEAARLHRWWRRADAAEWEKLGRRWYDTQGSTRQAGLLSARAQVLVQLARALAIQPETITAGSPNDLVTLLHWLHAFSPRQRVQAWLDASEQTGQAEMLNKLAPRLGDRTRVQPAPRHSGRPLAQFAFCIDVRSEVLRRHLELRSGYETFGFAGFFGVPISYRSLDEPHESELCPVLIKPKHVIREVPRAYQGDAARKRKASAMTAKAGQELLHDLKHNVITPYVMVEAIGWFFAWPLLGKTFFPGGYHRLTAWVKNLAVPKVATTLTVDKLTGSEAHEMVAAEQRMQILRWLRARHQVQGDQLRPDVLEHIRAQALGLTPPLNAVPGELGHLLVLTKASEEAALDALRRECRITARDTSARIERLTRTGFTENEQAYYVETALRLMGMTAGFGRLIFICAHGSTSDNNPYESALDCGACGGSHGLPNARTFATIANRPKVRALLAGRGIAIPPDTHFVAALHDTTTDQVRVTDLEDFPSTHRKELGQVLEDVAAAGAEAAAERYARLAPAAGAATLEAAHHAIRARSHDWSQVRPEWGLAGNAFFMIAGRRLTQGTDLEGRSFLHSYDHAADEDGRLLEFIMTAPLIVAQWINMEYYFSTVDPDVYGSGSKIYHNVTGRIGVMTGYQSDLRMGLPVQTVMAGRRPYHEPKRLTAMIEAPRERIMAIIKRQPLLEKLLDNQWLKLVALDPQDGSTSSYDPIDGWRKGVPHDQFDAALDERDQDRRAGRPLEIHH